jgi:hypothetical protein
MSSSGAAPPPAELVDFSVVRALSASGRASMVIGGVAYDFTDFMSEHPGGAALLRKNAGKDASAEFLASHPVDIIEQTLSKKQLRTMTLGKVDAATATAADVAVYPAVAIAGEWRWPARSASPRGGGAAPTLFTAACNLFPSADSRRGRRRAAVCRGPGARGGGRGCAIGAGLARPQAVSRVVHQRL